MAILPDHSLALLDGFAPVSTRPTYQRFLVLLGTATLLGGYAVLKHVFYAAGMLSIIIEFVGGVFFLVYLLRKGSL